MVNNTFWAFFYLVAASVFNIGLAWYYGNDGLEAMMSAGLAICLLLLYKAGSFVKALFATKRHTITKLLLSVITMSFSLFTTVISLPAIFGWLLPKSFSPEVNWWLVIAGVISYLLIQGIRTKKRQTTLNDRATELIVLFYSLLTIYAGFLSYGTYRSEASVVLVIALQLQYIFQFLALKTEVMSQSKRLIEQRLATTKLAQTEYAKSLAIAPTILLFIVPPLLIVATAVFASR